MKVRLLSDVHLEFGDYDPGQGDVLVLAGDICVAESYENYHDFFVKCVENYNKVFYILGNHEHYHSTWGEAFWKLHDNLPKEVTLLNNTAVQYEGVNFVGATLWTNFNNMNLEDMDRARACMNDYHMVEGNDPTETLSEHLFTREWFEQALPTLNGPVFMITHHAPSFLSVKGRYVGSEPFYASDMSSLIHANPNVRWWAHGHVHESSDYYINNCRVITNPRGYHGVEENRNFDPNFEIDLTQSLD